MCVELLNNGDGVDFGITLERQGDVEQEDDNVYYRQNAMYLSNPQPEVLIFGMAATWREV